MVFSFPIIGQYAKEEDDQMKYNFELLRSLCMILYWYSFLLHCTNLKIDKFQNIISLFCEIVFFAVLCFKLTFCALLLSARWFWW